MTISDDASRTRTPHLSTGPDALNYSGSPRALRRRHSDRDPFDLTVYEQRTPAPEAEQLVLPDPALQPMRPAQSTGDAVRRQASHGWSRDVMRRARFLDVVLSLVLIGAYVVARWSVIEVSGSQALVILTPLFWFGLLATFRVYDDRVIGDGPEETRRILQAGLTLVAGMAFISYVGRVELPRSFTLGLLPLTVLIVVVNHHVVRLWLRRSRKAGRLLKRTVIVGDAHSVAECVDRLDRSLARGYQPVAACITYGSSPDGLTASGLTVFRGMESAAQVVHAVDADAVVVLTGPVMSGDQLRGLAWDLESTDCELLVSSGLVEVAGPRVHITAVDGLPFLNLQSPRFSGTTRLLKGTFDRLLSITALILLSPVLLAITLAIRFTSHGPAVFRQTRVGIDGRTFTIFKFRSMVCDAEDLRTDLVESNEHDGPLFKIQADPRITPVGRFLRRYSLDELPQLGNVALGQMSLVGPRPPLPDEVAQYNGSVHRRLLVKPGLTGLWQVSGRSDLAWDESVRLDLHYVDNWSLALDLAILWRTIRAVIKGHGAY